MEDHNEQLKAYIRQQLQLGVSSNEISRQLQHAGWPVNVVYNAFLALQHEMMPTHLANQAASGASSEVHSSPAPAAEPVLPQANGRKRGRVRMGWMLLKQSARILNGNRYLLRYLVMTGVWVLSITAVFVAIYVLLGRSAASDTPTGYEGHVTLLGYLFAFIDYLAIYFFINLYAAGLTANVLDIFNGQRQPYAHYMKMARSKVKAIFVFSLIAASVGMFLQYVVERVRFVGWIISWVLGTAWSLGTMFVIPIIMTSEKPSATRSVGQSIRFFKGTWGENVTAKVGVNLPIALLNIASFVIVFALAFPAFAIGGYVGIIFLFLLWFVFLLSMFVIGSFANSLINISLFYHAAYQKIPPSFSAGLLNSVFIKRKRRFFKKVKE